MRAYTNGWKNRVQRTSGWMPGDAKRNDIIGGGVRHWGNDIEF